MTITFKSDNNIIIYTLQKIIAFARQHHFIFVAQCIGWLATIIELEPGLRTHIDNLCQCYNLSSKVAMEELSIVEEPGCVTTNC
jgi:hypothetical protein